MNRIAKRVAAVTVAATLGVAALGFNPAQATGASWRESRTAEIGVITTGNLALSHQELSWTNANTGEVINDVTQVELAPGVVINGRASVTPELIGQDLTAELNARWAGVNISETAQQFIQLSAYLELVNGNIPVNPIVSIGRAAEDNGVEIPLLITLAIRDDANIPGMFSEPLDLGDLTISLGQTGPGGWRANNVSFDLPALTLAGSGPETPTPEPPVFLPPPPVPYTCPIWIEFTDGLGENDGYRQDDCVNYGGRRFVASGPSSGQNAPRPGDIRSPWMEVGDDHFTPDGRLVRAWTETWIYDCIAGVCDAVFHEGNFYRARWYVRGPGHEGATIPGNNPDGPWELLEFPPVQGG